MRIQEVDALVVHADLGPTHLSQIRELRLETHALRRTIKAILGQSGGTVVLDSEDFTLADQRDLVVEHSEGKTILMVGQR